MLSLEDAVGWARREAHRLRGRGAGATTGDLAPTAEFLRTWAGRNSVFSERADDLVASSQPGFRVTHMAELLDQWIAYVEAGMAEALPFEVIARVEADTDLMEQVQRASR